MATCTVPSLVFLVTKTNRLLHNTAHPRSRAKNRVSASNLSVTCKQRKALKLRHCQHEIRSISSQFTYEEYNTKTYQHFEYD